MIDGFWYYTVDPTADEPIMLIDGHIGFDEIEGFGVMGDMFQRELLQLDTLGKSRIQVWINSPGGIVSDGYSIYNAILKSKTKVDTYCTGMAASIAGVIFQAGRTRYMADYSWLMYHNPFGGDDRDALVTITESLAKMISERTGKSVDEIRQMMRKETYIMADECKTTGLCDVVEQSAEQNKKRATAVASNSKAFLKVASEITNTILKNKNLNTPDMKSIANKLNLNAEASEASIVAEIEAVQNKAKVADATIAAHVTTIQNKETEIGTLKGEVKAKEDELTQLKNKISQIEADQKKKEDEVKAENEKQLNEKVKNMIDGFVADGRIKNDAPVVESWTKKAKEDFDGVKNLIETLPINRSAAKIKIESSGEAKKAGSVVNTVMAKKREELEKK